MIEKYFFSHEDRLNLNYEIMCGDNKYKNISELKVGDIMYLICKRERYESADNPNKELSLTDLIITSIMSDEKFKYFNLKCGDILRVPNNILKIKLPLFPIERYHMLGDCDSFLRYPIFYKCDNKNRLQLDRNVFNKYYYKTDARFYVEIKG